MDVDGFVLPLISCAHHFTLFFLFILSLPEDSVPLPDLILKLFYRCILRVLRRSGEASARGGFTVHELTTDLTQLTV